MRVNGFESIVVVVLCTGRFVWFATLRGFAWLSPLVVAFLPRCVLMEYFRDLTVRSKTIRMRNTW